MGMKMKGYDCGGEARALWEERDRAMSEKRAAARGAIEAFEGAAQDEVGRKRAVKAHQAAIAAAQAAQRAAVEASAPMARPHAVALARVLAHELAGTGRDYRAGKKPDGRGYGIYGGPSGGDRAAFELYFSTPEETARAYGLGIDERGRVYQTEGWDDSGRELLRFDPPRILDIDRGPYTNAG